MRHESPAQLAARKVRLFIMDVDGVLTDGRLYYAEDGVELKAFNIQDGLGIKLLQRSGVEVGIITGRTSKLLARRATELGISTVVQGREDKLAALAELAEQRSWNLEHIAYIGDDFQDLAAIRRVGLGMTVANGSDIVAEHALWRSKRSGGHGAVREAAEFILAAQDKLADLVAQYL